MVTDQMKADAEALPTDLLIQQTKGIRRILAQDRPFDARIEHLRDRLTAATQVLNGRGVR